MEKRQERIKNGVPEYAKDLKEVKSNMYVPKNKHKKDNPEMQDLVVEWKNGIVKGFRSKEEAERYVNLVCKKAAPDMDFYISQNQPDGFMGLRKLK